MARFKEKYGEEKFMASEDYYNCLSSFCAGGVASSVTNALEVVTVKKQTEPKLSIKKIIAMEGTGIFTKGIFARITYNCYQSVLFFTCLNKIGKLFNVDLTD